MSARSQDLQQDGLDLGESWTPMQVPSLQPRIQEKSERSFDASPSQRGRSGLASGLALRAPEAGAGEEPWQNRAALSCGMLTRLGGCDFAASRGGKVRVRVL